MIGGASPEIPGVRFGAVTRHGDARGSFRELWRASVLGPLGSDLTGATAGTPGAFVQANLSGSAVGVLRGLHVHRRQLDYWIVSSGRAAVALVDVRPMLQGAPRPVVATAVLEADHSVVIPAGVAHGFLALDALEMLYLVTNEFDGTDELGFAWDDPSAAVPWPEEVFGRNGPILSERDQANPSLLDLVARLRGEARA